MPIAQEGFINSSPLVTGCVMFGREHEQPGILIEPSPEHAVRPDDQTSLIQFRNKIWYGYVLL